MSGLGIDTSSPNDWLFEDSWTFKGPCRPGLSHVLVQLAALTARVRPCCYGTHQLDSSLGAEATITYCIRYKSQRWAACCVKSMQGTRSSMVVTRARIILSMESPWMRFAAAWYWIQYTCLTTCICGEDGFTANNQSVEHLQQGNAQL